ncbi:MAG TPA: phosphoribosylglycinamide formyltransferase [Syntrophomonadaceae bacterium]|nr:phosphoribosylglycinamide formyltransferase [Syntrophomonadaceae bacterium]
MKLVEKPKKLKLAVMASGRGSNFDAIYQAIKRGDLNAEIIVLISDKAEALALKKAEKYNISALHINPKDYSTKEEYEQELVKVITGYDVDLVVLAGYMRLIGSAFLQHFKHQVVNIHPALLPSFTGLHAQRQALEYGVKYTGCTVHFVDEGMDTGPIIMQSVVAVYDDDDETALTERILNEEHQIYWQALQLFAEGRLYIKGRQVIIK